VVSGAVDTGVAFAVLEGVFRARVLVDFAIVVITEGCR